MNKTFKCRCYDGQHCVQIELAPAWQKFSILLCTESVTRTASLRIKQICNRDVGNIIKLGGRYWVGTYGILGFIHSQICFRASINFQTVTVDMKSSSKQKAQ